MVKWIFFGIIFLVVLILSIFIYGGISNRIKRNKQMKVFNNIFANKHFAMPTIEFGFSYWWPTFKLTFETSTDFQTAKRLGLLKRFEDEIGNIYGPPFDPKSAITYNFLD
jgi:hypothetical protein